METMAQMDAFFAGRPEEWAICEALRTAILARWPDTRIRVMKNCVSFDDPKPFCYASHPPRKSMRGLMVTFSQTEFAQNPRFLWSCRSIKSAAPYMCWWRTRRGSTRSFSAFNFAIFAI